MDIAILMIVTGVVVAAVILALRNRPKGTGTDSNGGSTRPGADKK